MVKYNIYIICKNEDIFTEKAKEINLKYKSKICHIQWVPAEYLKLTQCNKKMLKDLNTRYNTQQKKILAKLGCIAAHRKALLAIYSSKTKQSRILFSRVKVSSSISFLTKVVLRLKCPSDLLSASCMLQVVISFREQELT